MISRQAKYALRALIALARIPPGQSMLTAEVARRQKIPKKFLEQILLSLKRRGLVQSRRGALGGYALLKPADAITFAEVLRLIDGPMAPLPCLSVVAYTRCVDCTDEKTCEIRRAFARVAEATREVLERTTIADAVATDREGISLLASIGKRPATV
jgi:Rrf2 family protein